MADKTPTKKRRLITRVVIVLALLAVFVGLPAYLASRPAFYGKYPSIAEQHGPWVRSTHAGTGCQDCHVRPSALPQAAYQLTMVGRFYTSFVSKSISPEAFPKPSNEACLSCHDDLRSVSPKGDLRIPHKAHVNILKMECVACHNYLVHEKSPEGKQTPPMAGCLKCHDGNTAKNTCSACHTDKAVPATHRAADWRIVHGQKANAACNKCHQWKADWCADCHSRKPKTHTVKWREQHGEAIKVHRSCEACHDASFCTKCHGEVPQLNYNPLLKTVR